MTSAPSLASMGIWHDRSGRPSTMTVHEPHEPIVQPDLTPRSPSWLRNPSRRVALEDPSVVSETSEPLTVSATTSRASIASPTIVPHRSLGF